MGGKWKPLILFHLNSGPKRFGQLKRLVVGISEKVLIQQLRELAAAACLPDMIISGYRRWSTTP
jgi:DNA-binding HxlR family transcriptional regulator